MSEPLVLVYCAGRTIALARAQRPTCSVFGGPAEIEVDGVALPEPLHFIALLHHNELPMLGAPRQLWEIPLFFGMHYSGCRLCYTFERDRVRIEELSPQEASADWPYRGYPELLPYYPLAVSSVDAEDWGRFRSRAPNLPDEQPAECVVLVPPPVGLGFTLWGRSGDAEGSTLVFECNLSTKRVVAYNVCG